MTTIRERLEQGDVIILDGPTATQLEKKGLSNTSNAWSALANLEHPDVVREVHEDYINVGADIITANTFATSRLTLESAGLEDRTREMNTRAVDLAKEARDRTANGRDIAIAGSISHFLGWERNAQDKYLARRKPDAERLRANFQEQAENLAEAGCDLILLEMMRDVEMATYAIEAAVSTGLPVWVGYTCWVNRESSRVHIGEQLSYGDGPIFRDALQTLLPKGGSLMAVMHTSVDEVVPALKVLIENWKGPVGAYPHSGRMEPPNWQFQNILSPEQYLAKAEDWVRMGIQLVGACCGMGPEHVRLLKERLPERVQPRFSTDAT